MNANQTSATKSFAGRSARIAELCKAFCGQPNPMRKIIATIKAEFPGSSLCKIKSCVAANR